MPVILTFHTKTLGNERSPGVILVSGDEAIISFGKILALTHVAVFDFLRGLYDGLVKHAVRFRGSLVSAIVHGMQLHDAIVFENRVVFAQIIAEVFSIVAAAKMMEQ